MPHTKILNIDELRKFIKENIKLKATQSGKTIKIDISLEGQVFNSTEVEINMSPFKNDIWNLIRSDVQSIVDANKCNCD